MKIFQLYGKDIMMWIYALFLIHLMVEQHFKEKSLYDNKEETTAVITKITTWREPINNYFYSYMVGGSMYSARSHSTGIANVGDTILIIYDRKNPSVTEITEIDYSYKLRYNNGIDSINQLLKEQPAYDLKAPIRCL